MNHEEREKQDQFLLQLFERGIIALEKIASAVDPKTKTLNMRDVDRAKVYGEHLGRKLSNAD